MNRPPLAPPAWDRALSLIQDVSAYLAGAAIAIAFAAILAAYTVASTFDIVGLGWR